MIALIQRVSQAAVHVDGRVVGHIDAGLLALVCALRGDTAVQASQLAARVAGYRVFADDAGRMNRSLRDVGGALLAVPQFTLAADTHSGARPSFTPAAAPELARGLFDEFVAASRAAGIPVATGVFGAHMQVESINDGPVTFWLEISAPESQ
jgi:D-aminoacyl-tRNA deacylase